MTLFKKTIIFIVSMLLGFCSGQIGAGIFLLYLFNRPIALVRPLTFYNYLAYFGYDSVIMWPLIMATAIAALPVVFLLLVIIGGLLPPSPLKNLHGDARFSTKRELKKEKLLFDDDAYALEIDGSIKKKKGYKYPPVILGKMGNDLIADYSQLYTCVAASPGAGKGVGFVIPNLLIYPESCVVLDPKYENWETTAGFRKAKISEGGLGQECFLFAPDTDSYEGYKSHRWNPLDYVIDNDIDRLNTVKDITTILIPDVEGANSSFHTAARSLVNGIILFLFENPDEKNNRTLTRVLQTLRPKEGLEHFLKLVLLRCNTVDGILNKLVSDVEGTAWKNCELQEEAIANIREAQQAWEDGLCVDVILESLTQALELESEGSREARVPRARSIVQLLYDLGSLDLSDECQGLIASWVNNKNERGRDSALSIAIQDLEAFDSPVLAKATEKSDFRFEDLRKKRISIYVGVSPSGMKKYKRLLNLFFSQCITINTKRLPEHDPSLKHQCLMLIDEFVSLNKISIIQESAGYTRGYDMRYALVFQNMQQVESVYGREGAQALIKTIHNEVVLNADSEADAKSYSARIGNKTLYLREKSRSSGGKGGTSTSSGYKTYERALRLPQEISYMPDETQLIFKFGLRPIECEKIVWYKDKYFIARANWKLPDIPSLGLSEKSNFTQEENINA